MEEHVDIDFDSRILCPDGGCTGVVGGDGKCPVCGAQGEVPDPRSEQKMPGPGTGSDAEPEEEGFDDRVLCPDGACVGVMGSDGKCRVCGASGAS